MSTLAFGAAALDPFKPTDLVAPPGIAAAPPYCPVGNCGALLHPVRQNEAGDQMFECLNGDIASAGHYTAIYRVKMGTWEQHPAFPIKDWIAPNQKKVAAAKTSKPGFAERMRLAREAKKTKPRGRKRK